MAGHIRSRSQAFRSSKTKSENGGGGGNRSRAARLKRMFGYSFQFIRKLDNKVSIRARNGKFLRMDSKGRLVAVCMHCTCITFSVADLREHVRVAVHEHLKRLQKELYW